MIGVLKRYSRVRETALYLVTYVNGGIRQQPERPRELNEKWWVSGSHDGWGAPGRVTS